MKKIIIFILSVFILTACSSASRSVTLTTSTGEKIPFSSLKGKWVFINYWATWCHSCRAEMPELNQFYQSNTKNVALFAVNYDSLQSAALNQATQALKIHFPVLAENPAKSLNLPDTTVVPTTYVFNPQGKLVKTLLGPQTKTELEKIISQ